MAVIRPRSLLFATTTTALLRFGRAWKSQPLFAQPCPTFRQRTRLSSTANNLYQALHDSSTMIDGEESSAQQSGKQRENDAEDSSKGAPGWTACTKCHGEGKIYKPPSRKARLKYKRAKLNSLNSLDSNGDTTSRLQDIDADDMCNGNDNTTNKPPPRMDPCSRCNSAGIIPKDLSMQTSSTLDYPHIAIIGGGLGGLALAIACQHRNIPCTVFERDAHFLQRSQGYGLTMQQAARALTALGIPQPLPGGITSTKHVVHTPDGTVVGEWGLRKWGRVNKASPPKRQNIHIARQALRQSLLRAVREPDSVIKWNHQLVEIHVLDKTNADSADEGGDKEQQRRRVELTFRVGGNEMVTKRADLVVGADGLRSTVRQILIGENVTPLRYLKCLVVLGIIPNEKLAASTNSDGKFEHPLLDGETVFQTANGETRIYIMPFSATAYMWQLSFPMESEAEAKELSQQGAEILKAHALEKCHGWHDPIPDILEHTPAELVTGYPVYDRQLLTKEHLPSDENQLSSCLALLGDAAHPMSPFKGQGANQALLDALALARVIYKTTCRGDRPMMDALREYEEEMMDRSAVKVKASAEAAKFLHTDVAIQEGNVTRGAAAAKSGSTG